MHHLIDIPYFSQLTFLAPLPTTPARIRRLGTVDRAQLHQNTRGLVFLFRGCGLNEKGKKSRGKD